MKITAVIEDAELNTLKRAVSPLDPESTKIECYGSDLEAVQGMYIKGLPDLLVVDLDKEAVIGLDTIRALKKQAGFEGLPILLISDRDLKLDAHAAGAGLLIARPIGEETFRQALKFVMSSAPTGPVGGTAPSVRVDPEAENRKAVRKRFETACIVSSLGQKFKGLIKDISLSGAQIVLAGDLDQNSLITLILGVPGTVPLKVVQFKARIVRKTRSGYGVAFRQMDPDTRSFVISYTQK